VAENQRTEGGGQGTVDSLQPAGGGIRVKPIPDNSAPRGSRRQMKGGHCPPSSDIPGRAKKKTLKSGGTESHVAGQKRFASPARAEAMLHAILPQLLLVSRSQRERRVRALFPLEPTGAAKAP
jgi:hypothetical protein